MPVSTSHDSRWLKRRVADRCGDRVCVVLDDAQRLNEHGILVARTSNVVWYPASGDGRCAAMFDGGDIESGDGRLDFGHGTLLRRGVLAAAEFVMRTTEQCVVVAGSNLPREYFDKQIAIHRSYIVQIMCSRTSNALTSRTSSTCALRISATQRCALRPLQRS